MKRTVLIMTGVLVGILNGLFGSGGGILCVLFLEHFCRSSSKEAHATALSVILPLSLAGLSGYLRSGYWDWRLVLIASVGGSIGGVIGAKLLARLPAPYIHKIFGGILFLSAIRMVTA